MNYSGFLLTVAITCALFAQVVLAKKRAAAPKWKANSMPHKKETFLSEVKGKSLKLDCKAQGHPKPYIKWMKDGVRIQKNTPHMSTRKYWLDLENITVDMSGNYTCQVSNKHGAIDWTFIVSVEVWPLVVEGPKDVTQMVGANVAFQCRVLNDPKATISWQRAFKEKGTNKKKTEFIEDGDNPEVLLIENIKKEDEGEYFCIAGNIKGLKYSTAWLTVLEPEPTIPPTRPFGFDNKDISYTVADRDENDPGGLGQPNIFSVGNTFFTTTKRPRKNNGRRKNKKNKKNKNRHPKTRAPPPPTTTPLPTESSTFWLTDDSTPSTPSTLGFYDRYSTFPNSYFTDVGRENGNEHEGMRGNGYKTDINPGESGVIGQTKEKEERDKDISEWKIYTIVGAVGGVVLLIGLIAITIAVCCPKQEGAVYKSTQV